MPRVLPQLSGAEHERAQLRDSRMRACLGRNSGGNFGAAYHRCRRGCRAVLRSCQLLPRTPAGTADARRRRVCGFSRSRQRLGRSLLFFWREIIIGCSSIATRHRTTTSGVEEKFPDSPDADPAQWRVAWTAVLKRQPAMRQLLEEHLRRFPGSQYTPDALYWLGRLAEEAQNTALARSLLPEIGRTLSRTTISRYLASDAPSRPRPGAGSGIRSSSSRCTSSDLDHPARVGRAQARCGDPRPRCEAQGAG